MNGARLNRQQRPDFEERQFVGERGGVPRLQQEMATRMRDRGANWARMTYLPGKDLLVCQGWLVRPDDDGPEPT